MQRQQNEAVKQATAAQKELMDQMKIFITEYKQQPQPEAKPIESEKSPKLESKAFHHMTKFSTGDAEWTDWSFDFKMLVRSINPWLTRWFEMAESTELEMTTELMQDEYKSDVNPVPKDLNLRDGELFK